MYSADEGIFLLETEEPLQCTQKLTIGPYA
jgi:hypothetical protein